MNTSLRRLTGKVARGEATPSEVEKAKGVAKGVAKAAELADTVAKSNGEVRLFDFNSHACVCFLTQTNAEVKRAPLELMPF